MRTGIGALVGVSADSLPTSRKFGPTDRAEITEFDARPTIRVRLDANGTHLASWRLLDTRPAGALRSRIARREAPRTPLEPGAADRVARVLRDRRRPLGRSPVARPRIGRPAQRTGRSQRGHQRRGGRERRSHRRRAPGRVRGLRHRRCHHAHQQPRRHPGAGGLHQRRDRPPADDASRHAAVRGDYRRGGVRRLLRRGRRGRHLCEPVQHGGLHRGADGRLRLRRCDAEARRGRGA